MRRSVWAGWTRLGETGCTCLVFPPGSVVAIGLLLLGCQFRSFRLGYPVVISKYWSSATIGTSRTSTGAVLYLVAIRAPNRICERFT